MYFIVVRKTLLVIMHLYEQSYLPGQLLQEPTQASLTFPGVDVSHFAIFAIFAQDKSQAFSAARNWQLILLGNSHVGEEGMGKSRHAPAKTYDIRIRD